MAKLFYFHPAPEKLREKEVVSEFPPHATRPRARRRRTTLYAIVLVALCLLLWARLAHTGNPARVAGTSYFDTGLAGQPLTWSAGAVIYFTDQGDLSPALPGPDADAFVADAFSRWTAIPTAAVSATRGGQLAEDVSGANVILNPDRSITLPADISSTATAMPLGIVYDADGSVTDALLGAGSSSDCIASAAFGTTDAFSVDGHFAHALVILNGTCAQTADDLPDLKYRLVRILGRVLGLGWSQLNLNVITGSPNIATPDDKAGFPVMHAQDSINCDPVSICYPNADQPRMDDRAAIARLYPVTSQNIAQFPGKQVFASNTARIYGSVRFTGADGSPGRPMQGVNVVARWIDPVTKKPSGVYAASSVSGFLFCGNAGNDITGYDDALGEPYKRFGTDDASLEGFFDLAGLEIPIGTTAQYQLSVEALDPLWSGTVGPYAPGPVSPSGSAQPIIVNVSKGDDVQQDMLMIGSATEVAESSGGSFDAPLALPKTGEWQDAIGSYGDSEYYLLNGQAGRTLSIAVTALDENGVATDQKAQPVIGMWSLTAPEGTPPPAFTPSSFNAGITGLTLLNAQLLSSTQFRIGISDLRGDGRPDFRYQSRVLYGDTVTPSRVAVQSGTPLLLQGLGLQNNMSVTVGGSNATLLAASPSQLVVAAPPQVDGPQSITISDPETGGSSTLQNALTAGAGPDDIIRLTQGGNSPTPVGGETPDPVRVLVTTADGSTPVSGATVQWNSTNGATLTACGGASSCFVVTDESGKAETRVRIGATGTANITASLAPASYSPAKSVQTVANGTSSAKDLVILSPKVRVAKGSTLDVPLTARLLANGAPVSGQGLNFMVSSGSGSVNPATSATDSDGYGRSTLHVNSLATEIQGSVCAAPANNPCQSFYVMIAANSDLRLESVSGSLQAVPAGQSFRPLSVRVTDSASSPNPVMGATVAFQSLLFLPSRNAPVQTNGDSSSSQHAMKVLLSSSQNTVQTDGNGLASLQLASGLANRALDAEITASTGTGAALQFEWQVLPPLAASLPGGTNGTGSNSVNRTVSAPPRVQKSQLPPRKVWSGKADAVGARDQARGGYAIFNYVFQTPPSDPCKTDQAPKEQAREDSASESSDSDCRK